MIAKFFTRRSDYLIFIFTVGYVVAFAGNAFLQANFEFLYYILLMVGLIYLAVIVNRHLHLAFFIIINLSILGFLHLLGGNLYLGGIRLYDYYFIHGVIRYDNLIHAYGTFIATLTLYSLLVNFIDERARRSYFLFYLMLVLMAIGIGTIVELIELFAVVFLGATQQVGDYFNNALDLLFNTLGSALACTVLYLYRSRPHPFQLTLPYDKPRQNH